MNFLSSFNKKFNEKYAPNDFYGGSFWTLYEYEGAGCSALCLTAMAVSNLVNSETNSWMVRRKIPMTLVGGELNQNHKVKIQTVKTTRQWYNGTGLENVDYINFEIYDPSIVAEWISRKINSKSPAYTIMPDSIGISFDCREVEAPNSLLKQSKRERPSVFIKNYYQQADIPYSKEN